MLDDGSFPCAVERAMRKLIYLGVWSTQELGWEGSREKDGGILLVSHALRGRCCRP